MLEGNENGSWFPSSVAVGDVMTLEGLAAKYDLSSLKLKDSILMGLDLRVVPGQD